VFEIQKAIYEVGYELAHRPAWVPVPLGFLLEATT
jgi:predicted trehalose synthase